MTTEPDEQAAGDAGRLDHAVRLSEVFVDARGELFRDGSIVTQCYPPGFAAIERRDAAALGRAAARAMVAPRRLAGEWLFVTDRWSGNYYHWMCEVLPRLERHVGTAAGARLLIPAEILAQPFVRASLAAYPGIVPEPFGAGGGNLLVEALVVPAPVAPAGHQDRELTLKVADRLMRFFGLERAAGGRRRIHASRAQAAKRRLANEAEIAPVLARHGFETVIFETMDLAGQIALMRETRVLAGVHGAGLTNMMFMAAGGSVVELRQRLGPPESFVELAANCGHRHFSLACAPADAGVHVHAADLAADAARLDALLAMTAG